MGEMILKLVFSAIETVYLTDTYVHACFQMWKGMTNSVNVFQQPIVSSCAVSFWLDPHSCVASYKTIFTHSCKSSPYPKL